MKDGYEKGGSDWWIDHPFLCLLKSAFRTQQSEILCAFDSHLILS